MPVVDNFDAAHEATGTSDPWISNNEENIDGDGRSTTSSRKKDNPPPDDRIRLLDRLFAWKAGEVWREVVLICGTSAARGGNGYLCSACELEVRFSDSLSTLLAWYSCVVFPERRLEK